MPVPEVLLTQSAADFMDEVTYLCKGEVGGLGYVTVTDEGDLLVDEVFLIPQEVSTGSVEFTPEAIALGVERAVNDDRLNDLRFSWHSHGELDTFWSTTDEGAIKDYLAGGAPWLLSMVVNRGGKRLGRLDVAGVSLVNRVKFDELDVQILTEDRTNGAALAAVEANVTQKVWIPKKGATTGKGMNLAKLFDSDGPKKETPPLENDAAYQYIMALTKEEEETLRDNGYNPDKMTMEEQHSALVECAPYLAYGYGY